MATAITQIQLPSQANARPAWQGPRGRDQGMQPILQREGTQPQRQARHQEQPADAVGWPPGSKDETHDGDGQVYYFPEDVGDVPSHHVRWHQVPVHIRPRQPAGYQRYRHPAAAQPATDRAVRTLIPIPPAPGFCGALAGETRGEDHAT